MKKKYVYIGNTSNNGIYKYEFVKKKLVFCDYSNDFERCTYLAKNGNNIYGVLELNNNGYIVSYIDRDGNLINTGKSKSYGHGPCHISVNYKSKLILVSNYIDGFFTIFKLNKDGTLGKMIYNTVLAEGKSHVHCSHMISDNLICMVDLGTSTIVLFEINKEIKEISRLKLGENIQPRHFVINNNQIVLITEATCRLYVISYKGNNLKIMSYYSILPENIEKKENDTGCAIKSTKNNKYIYVSIRGNNSISVFKRKKNKCILIQNIGCGGTLPWDIEISDTEKYIFVANHGSNNVSIFKRNKLNGKIKLVNNTKVERPTCIIAK